MKTLMNNFVTIASEGFRLYVDIDGYDCPSRFFRSSRPQDPEADKYRPRPDIVIQERNKTTIIELTCPFETNLEKSRDYKKTRYKNIGSALLSPRAHFNLTLWHCVKSVQIWSFFWFVFSCIRIEYRKIRTRKNSVFGHFSRSVGTTLRFQKVSTSVVR